MTNVVPLTPGDIDVAPSAGVLSELQRFEDVVRVQLATVGLPSDQVFVEVGERHAMLSNVSGVLAGLPSDVLGRSYYISKMIAATSVGLFDAALNYLWDELINELRRRVTGFDLKYFYDIAAGSTDLRKHLRDEDDLPRIDDSSLLRAAKEIGLLTDVGFQRLDHIRFMRNHASAAHPNQVTLSGLDLANWLQICIREVITTPPDTVTANTGRLLANIKTDRLDSNAVRDAAAFFDQLPRDRVDTLANGLFGLYSDPDRTPVVADNVRTLWPKLWTFVSEATRKSYGLRHARARASAETNLATAARELLDLVDGAAYLTEEVRAVEMDEALDNLRAAHNGMNNFYNEAAPARRLDSLVGEQGNIPELVRSKYVTLLVEVFLGNGYGVPWAAVPIYRSMLERLDSELAGQTLRAFLDVGIASLLWNRTARTQWSELLDIAEPKLVSTTDRELLEAIRSFTGTPDQLGMDTKIKKLATKTAGD
jgi:hypothetical protein